MDPGQRRTGGHRRNMIAQIRPIAGRIQAVSGKSVVEAREQAQTDLRAPLLHVLVVVVAAAPQVEHVVERHAVAIPDGHLHPELVHGQQVVRIRAVDRVQEVAVARQDEDREVVEVEGRGELDRGPGTVVVVSPGKLGVVGLRGPQNDEVAVEARAQSGPRRARPRCPRSRSGGTRRGCAARSRSRADPSRRGFPAR